MVGIWSGYILSSDNTKKVFAYVIMIVFWGSAFAGIKSGLNAYSPEGLSFLRLLVGAITLLIVAIIKRMPFPELKDIPKFVLFGAFGFSIYQTALNYGEKTISAGATSLLVSTSPFMISILSILLSKEKQEKQVWIGSLVGLLGVFLISFGANKEFSFGSGTFFVLLASFSESLYFVFQERLLKKYGFFFFTTYSIWGAAISMFFALPEMAKNLAHAPLPATLSGVFLGIFPTVTAYLALAYITSITGAAEAAVSFYLVPAAAFVIAWIWLGELPHLLTICGGILTLIGVLIAQSKPEKIKSSFIANKKNQAEVKL